MKHIARFIPNIELNNYEEKFSSDSFQKVLDIYDLMKLNKSDIVKFMSSLEDNFKEINQVDLIETYKLLDYGPRLQILLTKYEVINSQESYDVVQVWEQRDYGNVFMEYLNGELIKEEAIAEFYNVYNHFIKIPEVNEADEENLLEIMYDPASCIRTGSCCIFEGQRYEHCGKTCGIYENAGGGTSINSFDTCCRTHDREIRGKSGKDRCTPHKNFIKCTDNKTAPGDFTIRTGIRADALVNGCGFI